MALKIEIKPGERIIIGKAVVTNSGQRAHLQIEGESPILREKDIMRPEDANTPCKRIYLSVLMMYLADESEEHYPIFLDLMKSVQEAAPSTLPYLERISNEILNESFYKALKETRKLVEYETELLENAGSH